MTKIKERRMLIEQTPARSLANLRRGNSADAFRVCYFCAARFLVSIRLADESRKLLLTREEGQEKVWERLANVRKN